MIDKRPRRSPAAPARPTWPLPSASPPSTRCRSRSAAAHTTWPAPPWSTTGSCIDLSAMRGVQLDASRASVHVQGGATWADVGCVTPSRWPPPPRAAWCRRPRGRPGAQRGRFPSAPPRRHDRGYPRVRRGRARRRPPGARGALVSTPTCTGRCAAVGTSAWSPRSSSACTGARPGGVRAGTWRNRSRTAARVLAGRATPLGGAPDELSTAGLIWSLPVIDDLPEELRGRPVRGVGRGPRAGHPARASASRAHLRELATPSPDMSARMGYVDFQRSLDLFFPAGARRYWKALYLDGRPPPHRHHDRVVGAAPRRTPRWCRPPRRRRDLPRRRRGHRFRRHAARSVDAEHRLDLAGPGRGPS